MDTQIGKLVGQLHNRIYEIKQISKFTNFKTRLSFMNAHVIGKLNYILPMYAHANKILINKLHKIVTTAARGAMLHNIDSDTRDRPWYSRWIESW